MLVIVTVGQIAVIGCVIVLAVGAILFGLGVI